MMNKLLIISDKNTKSFKIKRQLLKIFNKDVLSLGINKSVNTYWVEKGLSQNMDKQY